MISLRPARESDAGGVLALLSQVLEVHAAIRPDIFVSGKTKYSYEEVVSLFRERDRLSYVAEDENGKVAAYALCVIEKQKDAGYLVPFSRLYIDDFCVDASERGRGIGRLLFDFVKAEAKAAGFYEITLNVWEGNGPARAFYEKMGMKPKSTTMELIL